MIEKLRDKLSKHEFLKHVLVLMSGTTIAQAIPIAASPIISRLYSPHEMGVFTIFLSFVTGLVTVCTGRYELAVVLPPEEPEARALVKLSQRVSTWVCAIAGAVLLLFAAPISEAVNAPEVRFWLPFAGLVAWAYAQVSIFNYWCNRRKKYRLMGTNRINQQATTVSTQLGMGFLHFGTTGLIISTLLGQLAASFTMWLKNRSEVKEQPIAPLKAVASEHRKMPLANAPVAALDAVRTEGTPLMMAAMFSTAATGQFGQAWKLLQTPASLINTSLSQVFFRSLATTPRGHMSSLVRKSILRSALIGAVPFLIIFFASPPLFPFIFGERWAEAGLIGSALVPWLYVNFITSPISMLFVVARRQGIQLWFAIPFTATPFVSMFLFHDTILQGIWALSLAMATMLLVFLGLALWVAHSYDREADPDTDTPAESAEEPAEAEEQTTD